jgi:hypothetical protein
MWPPGALDFLRELEDNNDRDWFRAALKLATKGTCVGSCIGRPGVAVFRFG